MSKEVLNPQALKTKFSITDDDLNLLREFGKISTDKLNNFIDDFYRWLPLLEEYKHFFQDAQKIQAVKNRQNGYWKSLFHGRLDQEYIDVRYQAGMTHARIGLSISSFCAGVNFSINWWGICISEVIQDKNIAQATFKAFQKLCILDTALISDFYCNDLFLKVTQVSDETHNILERATTAIEQIAVGEVSIDYKSQLKREERLADAIRRLTENLRSIIKQALSIAKGNFATELQVLGPKDELGASLVEMTKMLREMDAINKLSNWVKTGQAELSNVMKGDQDIYSLAKKTIGYLCKYLDCLIGTIYIVHEEEGNNKLKIVGTYAYDRRRAHKININFGEGLVGQAALEKEIIIFSDVPDTYITIGSSLGSIAPKYLAIIPVMVDNNVYGVIELGSHKFFPESQLEFLRQISNNIAQSIKTTQDHGRIKKLLEESNAQTIKLRSQQEKLRQSNDELEAQQKKLQNSNYELEQKAVELKNSEDAIKKKNAELEEISERLQKQKSEIEIKNQDIEKSKREIETKATELEISSKYKSEFLANMSHELRTPLNSILILSENLTNNEEGNLNSEQIEAMQIIHSGGKDLLALINDILDLSKVEAGKLTINMESVNLKKILERLKRQFEPIAKRKGLPFITHFDENIWPYIATDGLRIEQILKNFLSNAFKFTDSGEVSLKFYLPPDKGNFLAISVKDTGIGIKKDKFEIIFEAFQQVDGATNRRFGGTGLGLSIAKQLARLLKCKIDIKSKEQEGSEFTLYMPYEKAKIDSFEIDNEPIPKNKILALEKNSISEKKLLIIEDDKNFCQILTEQAKKNGFMVLRAHNAKAGLDVINNSKPSAIILDIHLPDQDGNIILKKIKENSLTRNIPIWVISVDEDRQSEVISLGALGFLTKPVSAESLNYIFKTFEQQLKQLSKRVLIIEDDNKMASILKQKIENNNVKGIIVDTARDALEILINESIDAIVLDLILPDMSGLELLKKLEEQKAENIPAIFVNTAHDLSTEEHNELSKYAMSFVIKGSNSEERLLEELHLFLEKSRKQNKTFKNDFHDLETDYSSLEGKKVLLVDDDMRNTYALSAILRKKGLHITMADNGKLAVEKLELNSNFDLIIMDIMMPIMDGYEAMKKIRQNPIYKNIPIIALTAKVLPEDKTKALTSGANDFLTKPVEIKKLLKLISAWMPNNEPIL